MKDRGRLQVLPNCETWKLLRQIKEHFHVAPEIVHVER